MKKLIMVDISEEETERLARLLRDNGFPQAEIVDDGIAPEKPSEREDHVYFDLYDNAPIGIFRSTPEGKIIAANRACAWMLGYDSPEQLIREVNETTVGEALYEDPSRRGEIARIVLSHNGWCTFEIRLRTRNGTTIICSLRLRAVFRGEGTVEFNGFIDDISEQKSAEREASFFRALVELTGDPVYALDPADGGRMVYANRAACAHFGKSLAELQTMRIPDWDPVFNMDKLEFRTKEMKQRAPIRLETMHRVASGELVPVEITASYLELDGRTLHVGHFSNITERKLAEEELRESEARYRGLVELFPDAIYIHTGGRLVFANPQGARLLGAEKPEELYGREALDFVHPDSRDFVIKRIEHAFRTGEPNPPTEELFVRLDGTPVPVEVSSTSFDLHGEKALQILARNISGRKKRQEEELRAQKLESLGVLAGGIAHDFNNLLTAIMGNLSLIGIHLADDNKARERIARCERAVREATGLTCQLLTFSRGGEPVKKVMDVGNVVQDAVAFVLRGSNVAAKLIIAEDLWPIEADEGQISQVINNLIINADQSMLQGGVVRVELDNCRLSDGMTDLAAGPYVRISIADQGCGIPPENLGRIFDPYFTTKKTGTGLGLSSLYSIVRKHGGEVRVSSRVGEGTTFQIYLPASPGGRKEESRPATASNFSGGGHVIVMDDEESIREVAAEMLSHLGYRVTPCACGEEAIALYAEELKREARPLCIIMDLTVPGRMGGLEASEKILKIDPEAKLIVSSGYSNDPVMADYAGYGFALALLKPFRLEELSAAMKKIAAEER